MNILVILSVIVGVVLAQPDDNKDCEPRQSSVSVRDVQDIYQRPLAYDSVDYSPHSTYGPPEPVRPIPRRQYPQDSGISEGASNARGAFIPPPTYNDIRQQFPLAPVYGPPPPRARVAAAAGIYDDYEDISYAPAQPALFVPPVRRYNINYAPREPYQPNVVFDTYSNRIHEVRVPVYYAPVLGGYYPVRPTSTTTLAPTTIKTTTEEPQTFRPPIGVPITHSISSSQLLQASSEEETVPRKLKRPFLGLANLFRGSILASRNKIGAIPSIVQGSVQRYT